MKKVSKKLISTFDVFGKDVSPLNIRGETKQTTVQGGLTCMAIFVVLVTFTVSRLVKLITRDDPTLYQV